jgi:DNA polymerase-3 subunit delta'
VTVWDVPGQEHAVGILSRAVERDEVSHAWAFIGPAGVGQEAATRWLAAALNCGSFTPPCGACDVCRRCLRGAYPALVEFSPTGAAYLKSEVAERWLRTATRSLAEGRFRVLRIAAADRMNEAAANAFLKGLEEPPPATAWVLEITDPDELPDTILSRCRIVRFSALPEAVLEVRAQVLGLEGAGERALAVRASMGSPLALERFAQPRGMDDLRAHRAWPGLLREGGSGMALLAARALDDEVKRATAALKAEQAQEIDDVTDMHGGTLPAALGREMEDRHKRQEREAKVVTMQAALDDLAGWLRDCIVVAQGGEPVIHLDAVDSVGGDAAALGPARLLQALDLVLATREALELNVQPVLTMEAMFLELSALGYA